MTSGQGHLILAGNCLGNPEDIPARSLKALHTADLLIFEEPRVARQTLKAAGLHRDFLRLTEHGEADTLASFSSALQAGQTVVYMSDQGMPGLADPGHQLATRARAAGARLSVIPGPSSVTAALAACPFPVQDFYFAGFLPRKEEARQAELKRLSAKKASTVILDTPYRLPALLASCAAAIGKDEVFLALDIGGEHEDYLMASAATLRKQVGDLPKNTNFVLILPGDTQ